MLYDFFYIELFFGKTESPQKLESLIASYGLSAVINNIAQGYLHIRPASCQSEKNGFLCWLSDSGRDYIARTISSPV
jgi:hypothetical protein